MKTGNTFLDLTELFVSLHSGINLRISGNDYKNLLQTEQTELQAGFAQLMKKGLITYLLKVCFKILHKSM